MEKFAYEILVGQDHAAAPGGIVWYRSSDMNQPAGPQLPVILNQMGSEGWEVCGVGDVGFSSRTEIILKKRLPEE